MKLIQIWRRNWSNESDDKQNHGWKHNKRSHHDKQNADCLQEVKRIGQKKIQSFHKHNYVTGLMTTQVSTSWLTNLYMRTVDSASQVFGLLFFSRNSTFVARSAS